MDIAMVITQLNGIFDKANDRFYEGKLERPVITVSPDMTAGAYGWFTTWKAWEENNGDGYYEINITAEYLNREIHETIATLLHEMVHMGNLLSGIKDTSRGGTYHNKKFKVEAEQRGLTIENTEKYGWTKTSLNEDGNDFVESLGIEDFGIRRVGGARTEVKGGAKKSSSKKYVCPVCGMIVRATKEVNIVCGDCQEQLELEE